MIADTALEINAMVFAKIMALTEAERFLMSVSMMATAREIVWASVPDGLDEPTRRSLFFERFYGQPLPTVVAHWKSRG